MILITHRVAAAARCDQRDRARRGRVVERGTHEELLKNGGLYAAFAEEQRIEQRARAPRARRRRAVRAPGGHRAVTSSAETPSVRAPAGIAAEPALRWCRRRSCARAPTTSTTRAAAAQHRAILREFHEESALGKAYDARLIARLWPFVRPYRGLLSLSLGGGDRDHGRGALVAPAGDALDDRRRRAQGQRRGAAARRAAARGA